MFDESEIGAGADNREAPDFFTDLNLDQVVASITAGREEYNLKPFFYVPLSHVESVMYRQEILRDLENPKLLACIRSFAERMRIMRGRLARAERLYYPRQKQRWFLDAADVYFDAVASLARDLTDADPRSRGFLAFREYLASYIASAGFVSLLAATRKLITDLSGVRYCIQLHGYRVKVSRYDQEPDYGADVLHTFEKFKQGAGKEYKFEFYEGPNMDHVEAAVLDRVARLFPDIFLSLEQYGALYRNYLDETMRAFDREIQFYIAYLEYIARLKAAGLAFCYPTVTNQSKEIHGREVFDLALANKLAGEGTAVVTNDFDLNDPERIFVVSAPNQGGKTTFARTFGQLHYLAGIGLPVPGGDATLFLCDRLFTHFEREEDITNLRSKLEDDLHRLHAILEKATANTIIIMNESFVSTTLDDALFLSKQIMRRIIERDMLCVTVTFLDELASLSQSTVSMVSTTDPQDRALRTFKIVRRPADGLAHAAAIAEKYHLTYECLKERIAS